MEREQQLADASKTTIVFSPPLVTLGEAGVIRKGTVCLLQGKAGVHKSRLAEVVTALLIKPADHQGDYLGFAPHALSRTCVAYVDTERNVKEEFPAALQSIKRRAGYALTDEVPHFRFTSIKGIERKHRLAAVETFIQDVRQSTLLHLFVVLDVATDAVSSFNDDGEAMRLFDFIGNLCEQYDSTFLLIVHENPGGGSEAKARGHVGTEALNKASTALQIGFEKDGNGNDTNLIKVRFLKLRSDQRPDPMFLQFDKPSRSLVLAHADTLATMNASRKTKAPIDEVSDFLADVLADGSIEKGDVVQRVQQKFDVGEKTARERLQEISDQNHPIMSIDGKAFRLTDKQEGRKHFYTLLPEEPPF